MDAAAAAGVRYLDRTMTDAELRVRIRELMVNGALPREPAPIERAVPTTPGGRRPHMFVSGSLLKEPCRVSRNRADSPQGSEDAAVVLG